MEKPYNPYKPGTTIYRLMDEDWSNKTKNDMMKETGATYRTVVNAIYRIKSETGYIVPYIDARKVMWRGGWIHKIIN